MIETIAVPWTPQSSSLYKRVYYDRLCELLS